MSGNGSESAPPTAAGMASYSLAHGGPVNLTPVEHPSAEPMSRSAPVEHAFVAEPERGSRPAQGAEMEQRKEAVAPVEAKMAAQHTVDAGAQPATPSYSPPPAPVPAPTPAPAPAPYVLPAESGLVLVETAAKTAPKSADDELATPRPRRVRPPRPVAADEPLVFVETAHKE